MNRRKTLSELRQEIMASARLHAKSQNEIAHSLRINQATFSRILRGQFRRCSPAVEKICSYAQISCMTDRAPAAWETSLERLTALATGRSANQRRALTLIRVAAELLEAGDVAPPRRLGPAAQA